ncbi:MAG: serine/threonine protein kinase [Candidatus Eisenbacteria bacterium]|uniref:Serine/threonine protein kinase n=1 Tax=Eiseniibacteriota bacterium TaxID=2212470 RepID=A0A538UB85_UNCEI|nr:MAG: serine/threonine protein kinase [Candidatus Eisenbacteria bacterium]
MFPLLVPAPPRAALTVSTLCALAMPAGLAFLAASGRVMTRVADFIGISLAGAVAVGIASVASRTVYGAGRQMAAARRVGSYELLEPLARGGMGEVWKARHLFLARPAAVKLILPEQLQGRAEDQERVIQRFTREAQVTAELCSPHTVDLFDFGVSADGALYYAMELLEGINAEHFVYQFGPIEPRRAAHWLQQACHSLGEAHARNLIHRDIKPSNLYVCRYGRDRDFVKILDFGLTKSLEPQTDPNLTHAGIRMGTPGYMAPEQIFGKEPGPRTDLYALGCVAYWLVSGVRPFEGVSVGELLSQHTLDPPPPPSRKAAHPLPDRLERLILSCLAKEPRDRPASADQVSLELEECFAQEAWSAEDARRWWDIKGQ